MHLLLATDDTGVDGKLAVGGKSLSKPVPVHSDRYHCFLRLRLGFDQNAVLPRETLWPLTIKQYYSSIILQSTGAKPSLISLLAGVLNIFFALGCYPLYFTIERVGRRSVLLYGACVMSVLMGVFMVLQLVEQTTAIGWASIGIIFVFLFVFGYAWQGCVWLYCSEIAPLEYRHVGGAFTACGEWLMTWLTVFVGPIGLANVGASFWGWVFSGNVVAIVFV